MRRVKSILLTEKGDPTEISLVNEFASLQEPLTPTTAIKKLLREILPDKIAALRVACQGKNSSKLLDSEAENTETAKSGVQA